MLSPGEANSDLETHLIFVGYLMSRMLCVTPVGTEQLHVHSLSLGHIERSEGQTRFDWQARYSLAMARGARRTRGGE